MNTIAEHHLRTAWDQALSLLGLDPQSAAATAIIADLLKRYSEPHRHWHTSHHIDQMLSTLAEWCDEPDPTLVLATLFHDAIYVAGYHTNEEQSAALAAKQLASLNAPQAVIEKVRSMILATRSHSQVADRDTALLIDADMAILGAGPALYQHYSAAVRHEHENISPTRYRAGRILFLVGCLMRPGLFQTAWGKRLQRRARLNMLGEIFRLLKNAPTVLPPRRKLTEVTLSTGTTCQLIEPGSHWVPGYQVLACTPEHGEPQPLELEELAALSVRFAREKASQVLGSADRYLLIQSGPGVRRKKHYHCHLIPLESHAGKAWVYLYLALKNFWFSRFTRQAGPP